MKNDLLLKNIGKNNFIKNSALREKQYEGQTITSNVARV